MKAYKHLVQHALATGANVSVWDGEEWQESRSTDAAAIIAAIESVEEAELVIRAANDDRLAWARIAAYGLADDETVVDYTISDYMENWEAAYDLDTNGEPLTIEQIRTAARILRAGNFGGFAAAIGDAATLADSVNLSRLAATFPDLFAAALKTANDHQQPQTIGDICGAPLTGSNW